MAKKNKKGKSSQPISEKLKSLRSQIHPETERSILAVFFIGIAAILILASFQNAGPAEEFAYNWLASLFGVVYFLFPAIFLVMSGVFLSGGKEKNDRSMGMTFIGAALFIAAGLGLIDILDPAKGGWVGEWLGAVEAPFGYIAGIIITATLMLASLLLTINLPLKLWRPKKPENKYEEPKIIIQNPDMFPASTKQTEIKS